MAKDLEDLAKRVLTEPFDMTPRKDYKVSNSNFDYDATLARMDAVIARMHQKGGLLGAHKRMKKNGYGFQNRTFPGGKK